MAEYGQAFRMRVLATDVREVVPAPGIRLVSFGELLRESDVLTIHIHLTEQNRRLLNEKAIRAMKKGAVLINTSRGAVVDEEALLRALEDGHLAAAGLDVIDGEWRTDLCDHPLIRYARAHQNLLISPHVGGVAVESQRMTLERITEKIVLSLEGLHLDPRDNPGLTQ